MTVSPVVLPIELRARALSPPPGRSPPPGHPSAGDESFERIQALRRTVYDSDDYQEGIAAFLEKREPRFDGR